MIAQHDISPLPVPERVTLELTNQCNLSCPVCPRHHMDYPLGSMDSALFRRLTDELSELGSKTLIPFFRGEPLLHPDCLDLLAYAKQKGFTIQLATNGLLMTERIARGFVEMGIDFVSFSVDAVQEETYARKRKGGSFSRLLQGMDFLRSARSAAGTVLPRIQVSAVDSGMDSAEKDEFISFWKKRADQIRIYPQHTKDGRFGSLDAQSETPRQPCLKPFREMVVYWDGSLALCNHDWQRKNSPDVMQEPIQGLWSHQWYESLRQQQRILTFASNTPCSTCGHWSQYCSTPHPVGTII